MIASLETQAAFQLTFETGLGWTAVAGTPRGLTRLTFGHRSQRAAELALAPLKDAQCDTPAWTAPAVEALCFYAAGEPVELSRIPLDLESATTFEQRVRRELQRVAYGQTTTYGALADAAGAPRAARAVGAVMAKNPVPLVIPCHRVLAAGGRLGGFSAPDGVRMKQRLLDMERAGFSAASR